MKEIKVRDILPNYPLNDIMVRTNYPKGVDDYTGDGILLGYVVWNGKELISLDGDTYYLDEYVTRYEWDNGQLIYWIHSIWSGDEEYVVQT